MANSTKLESLINAIVAGNYEGVKEALYAGRINGCIESAIVNLGDKETPLHVALRQLRPNKNIIKLLLENGANPSLENGNGETPLHVALGKSDPNMDIIKLLLGKGANLSLENSNGENSWCLVIKKRNLENIFLQQVEQLSRGSANGFDVKYHYSRPLNDKGREVNRHGDNYLHIAARAGNIDAFLLTFKKALEGNVGLLEYNEDHENPFHLAARMGMLLPAVKGMLSHLESTAEGKIKKLEDSIKKAKEAGENAREDQKKLREVKEKLESDKGYIKNALHNKCSLNKSMRTPLDCISKEVKNEVKKAAGIKNSFVCDRKAILLLCTALTIMFAVLTVALLCFLSVYSQPFALSSAATMAFGGFTYFAAKTCSGLYDMYNEGTSMHDVNVTPIAELAR
ncbi:ankyrin repeat domain-containing protein [Wolbachia endosymbiont of Ctenocephalides felis wCfeT]|uniref:ankyrin repeat domain-containing protein n=1 Tax=Wolbachia endosymbiont of Ctenocephalides felis wCfeT TaxID=2732593 RepID=UPI0014487668|nr:ankyrin repeat domain-containing protein [Wolbachia endosymbiont of Ctenocephalides felis wCfeT]